MATMVASMKPKIERADTVSSSPTARTSGGSAVLVSTLNAGTATMNSASGGSMRPIPTATARPP
jgi:hypothetical protein